jgi:hypothetical protein
MLQHCHDDKDPNSEVIDIHPAIGHILESFPEGTDKIWEYEAEFSEDHLRILHITSVCMPVPDGSDRTCTFFVVVKADVKIEIEDGEGEGISKALTAGMPEELANMINVRIRRQNHSAKNVQYWFTLDAIAAATFASKLRDEAIEEEAKLGGVDLSTLADNENEHGKLPHEE